MASNTGIIPGINDPSTLAARMNRDQWEHFKERYGPIEDKAIAIASGMGVEGNADRAGQIAGSSFATQLGVSGRQLSRRGISLNQTDRNTLARRNSLAKATTVAGAENLNRREAKQTNIGSLAALSDIGRGISASALQGIGSAADLQAQREATGAAQRSAKRAQNAQMASGLASMAIMAAIMA